MPVLTDEEIAKGVLAACDIEEDAKVYGRHDCYKIKSLLEAAVEQARSMSEGKQQ